MSDDSKPNNVLQFPKAQPPGGERRDGDRRNDRRVTGKSKLPLSLGSKAMLNYIGTFIAILFATGAINRYAFQSGNVGANEAAYHVKGIRSLASAFDSGKSPSRSVTHWSRNARWEMQLAESLASARVRSIASIQVGQRASLEDKLRWGLFEQYTFQLGDAKRIKSILLQDKESNPTYILDRKKFLSEYGALLSREFGSARLKSVDVQQDRIVEAYILFDKSNNPTAEAEFELDRFKRLLSLNIKQDQI